MRKRKTFYRPTIFVDQNLKIYTVDQIREYHYERLSSKARFELGQHNGREIQWCQTIWRVRILDKKHTQLTLF